MDVYYLHVGEQNFHRNFICFPQRKDGDILGKAMHIYMKEAFCIGKTPTRAFIIHSFDDSQVESYLKKKAWQKGMPLHILAKHCKGSGQIFNRNGNSRVTCGFHQQSLTTMVKEEKESKPSACQTLGRDISGTQLKNRFSSIPP